MEKKICGYYLDKQQLDIVYDDSKYLLVVAGAGSGKTLTILGKIYYLVEEKKINPNDILCISFTKASANSLKDKIKKEFNYSMPVYTFHKLSLQILKESNNNYDIADSNTLENIIHEFFSISILEHSNYIKIVFKYFNLKCNGNIIKKYRNFYSYNYQQIELLEKLLATFLHSFKCNNYKLIDFNKFLKQVSRTFSYKKYIHEKSFLILALNFYLQYQEYLVANKEIDFDDMIYYATDYIKENGINKKFKYVIIDEYQDTSYVRFCLVKEILNACGGNLMVVGDDFQSIYRFTGCDVSLFLNFQEYFNDSKIMKIENTYRNSQELIKIAGDFVMKNPKQIKKNLHSTKCLDNPVKIIYYDSITVEFKKIIEEIYLQTNKPILVLGRNNKDINLILDSEITLVSDDRLVYKNNKNIDLLYMTVHKSKGLEEENVIIINLENNFLGFPNQIKDDKILRLVSRQFEKYPYSEERRLFYVALTRTKNYVYLLVPNKNKSIFITELEYMIDKNG